MTTPETPTSEPCIIVTQKCKNNHDTAFAVTGVDYDDPKMGTKALDQQETRACSWGDCECTEPEDFISLTLYRSQLFVYKEEANAEV
jgi:hypothetical protein